MTTAYIALGSNIGDRLCNLATAVSALSILPQTHVQAASHAYESLPAYLTDQPAFANAVVVVETGLDADQLLDYLLGIEDDMGRERVLDNGPRVIDLDLLLFGDEEIATDDLVVPHPRMLERDFVVTPLLEVAPHVRLPDGGRIHRDDVTVGAVTADLGLIPDLGEESNDPVIPGEWVVVAENDRENDLAAGWDSGLSLKKEALEEAGIPVAFDPYEPETSMDPFGMPTSFKLMVPAADSQRAEKLIAALMAAKPRFPKGLVGEPEE
jgi:2-amino-4-hydroxy-6-hydroxymethyldihydropteridine diphosphokinase